MFEKMIWQHRAENYFAAMIREHGDEIAETLFVHEPGCPEYEWTRELIDLAGLTVESFLVKWSES